MARPGGEKIGISHGEHVNEAGPRRVRHRAAPRCTMHRYVRPEDAVSRSCLALMHATVWISLSPPAGR